MTGVNLRSQRIQLGLSQAKLAEIAGIDQARLSAFELDKNDLNYKEKEIIKKALASLSEVEIQSLKKKRYKNHKYDSELVPSRSPRGYKKTSRNGEYLHLLSELENQFLSNNKRGLKAVSFFAG